MKALVAMFIGKVGSGKSTYIQLVSSILRMRGLTVHKTYVKTVFILTPLLSRVLQTFHSSISKYTFLWKFCVCIDLVINVVLMPLMIYFRTYFTPLLLRRKVVLIEEHLPGIVVDYFHAAILLNLMSFVSRLIKFLFRFAFIDSKNYLIIHLQCNDDELVKRWILRNTLPERKTYLKVQDLIFYYWDKHFSKIVRINTDASITQVIRKLIKEIFKYLDSRDD